jgi:hypothetical protein
VEKCSDLLSVINPPDTALRSDDTAVMSLYVSSKRKLFVTSNFRHVLNVVCILLGSSTAYEFYMPTGGYEQSSYLSAYDDGTGRVFRNVDI